MKAIPDFISMITKRLRWQILLEPEPFFGHSWSLKTHFYVNIGEFSYQTSLTPKVTFWAKLRYVGMWQFIAYIPGSLNSNLEKNCLNSFWENYHFMWKGQNLDLFGQKGTFKGTKWKKKLNVLHKQHMYRLCSKQMS